MNDKTIEVMECYVDDLVYCVPIDIGYQIVQRRDELYNGLAFKYSLIFGPQFLLSFRVDNLQSVPEYQRTVYEEEAKIIRDQYIKIVKEEAIASYNKVKVNKYAV